MRRPKVSIARTLLLTTAAMLGADGAGSVAKAQSAPHHEIPQSIQLEHEEDIAELTILSQRPGAVGAAAKKALDLMKRHQQRELEYILPPLTLLPELSAGRATPDMRWAIEMANKVKANEEEIFQEHAAITDAMNALYDEALTANDKEAADFAQAAVAGSLGDMEIEEPTTLLIGEFLRAKLGDAP